MVRKVLRARTPRQTRASKQYKRRWAGVRPLPLNLQIMPPRCRPLPVNPGCHDYTIWIGARTMEFVAMGHMGVIVGRGLTNSGQCRIMLDTGRGIREFHTDDVRVGLAFARAAQRLGWKCEVYVS